MKEISFRCVDIDFLNQPILNESKGRCCSEHFKTSVVFSAGGGKRIEQAVVCILVFLPLCSNIFFAFFHELCAAYVHAFRVYLLKLYFFYV